MSSKLTFEDYSAKLAGTIANESKLMINKIAMSVLEDLAEDGLDIRPTFLLAGKLTDEVKALVESITAKLFRGTEPMDVAREILMSLFTVPEDLGLDVPED